MTDSLEQPSPLKPVPSCATGNASDTPLAMTLREQCEAFARKYDLVGDKFLERNTYDFAIQYWPVLKDLERLCRQQQAVGLREAALNIRKYNPTRGPYNAGAQQAIDWCEQQAREWEGMR